MKCSYHNANETEGNSNEDGAVLFHPFLCGIETALELQTKYINYSLTFSFSLTLVLVAMLYVAFVIFTVRVSVISSAQWQV